MKSAPPPPPGRQAARVRKPQAPCRVHRYPTQPRSVRVQHCAGTMQADNTQHAAAPTHPVTNVAIVVPRKAYVRIEEMFRKKCFCFKS